MKCINVKKGYNINTLKKPDLETIDLELPKRVALLPERIPYIKPKLLVKEGDKVITGMPIVEDKKNSQIRFMSPGTGEIEKINFGPRRVIKEIVIKTDPHETYYEFETIPKKKINKISREDIVTAIVNGGLWSLFREFPFKKTPDPSTIPPAIYVGLSSLEPFQPEPLIYLKGKTDMFEFGISLLKRLSDQVVTYSGKTTSLPDDISKHVQYRVSGKYPADDPGVFHFHHKDGVGMNSSWFITGQDLLFVASLLMNGRYPTDRTVSVTTNFPFGQKSFNTRIGAPISHLIQTKSLLEDKEKKRFIAGGLLRGYDQEKDSYIGFFETSLIVLSDENYKEFFGFARPGFNKPSYSRTFLSSFNKGPYKIDCRLNGELRACINCGLCAEVCAVDILPQFMMKAIHADEVEEALCHGLLDCVECGLCTYVCPCKIEMNDIFKKAKFSYYKEQL